MFWTDAIRSRYVYFRPFTFSPPFLPLPPSTPLKCLNYEYNPLLMKREHSSNKLRVFSWFMHYGTRRKVAGSNPDRVIGFLSRPNLSNRIMALGVDLASNRNEYQESSWG
jgi:hypothetical protein